VSINVDPLQSYDIWGTADAFRYSARPVTDDSSITVQVKSIENTPAIGPRPQRQCG
jgi:hypothetical protein